MPGIAGLLEVPSVNVAIEDGHVLIPRERVHNVIAVAGEPFPFRLQIEERPMSEDDDRRRLQKACDVRFEPSQLLRANFRASARDVVERDEMHALVIERIVAIAE